MIMDCGKYVGKCVCGRDHELQTKKVVVEYNAFDHFEQYMGRPASPGGALSSMTATRITTHGSSMSEPTRRLFSMRMAFIPKRVSSRR